MITYNYMREEWQDDSDPDFCVSMTPENTEACELTFDNQADFWAWYNTPSVSP